MKDDSFSVGVIKRILSILSEQGNVKRTALAGKTGLNYAALKRYAKFLQVLQWVDFSNEPGSSVSITTIGRAFEKILEGKGGPDTISEDLLERFVQARPEDEATLEERKPTAQREVKKEIAEIARKTSCALCGNPMGRSRITSKIDGVEYLFDKEKCAVLFKRFKDVYGKDFFNE